ncbi:MAG: DUF3035 domain-containing protein [Alphaproteobacteria bacterium]|nr:DUF3035 domain-containing protein [Alphaproteobacteria bacterium]
MPRRYAFLSVLLLGLVPAITGCQLAEDLVYGTKSRPPDEFQVVNQPPLSMPPDYGLRPPKPGATRPNTAEPAQRARQAVFGIDDEKLHPLDETSVASRTIGERALLSRAGATRANPEIRRILNTEGAAIAQEDRSLTEQLLFMDAQEKPTDETLDPIEEYRRIYGQPVPSAPSTDTGQDDPIFGYE